MMQYGIYGTVTNIYIIDSMFVIVPIEPRVGSLPRTPMDIALKRGYDHLLPLLSTVHV